MVKIINAKNHVMRLDGCHKKNGLRQDFCFDAYRTDVFEKGWSEAQIMETVHVACAIRGGASLVHGVQMMNKVKEIRM